MELIAALRILRSHRRATAASFVVAAAIGVLLMYQVSPGFPPKLNSKDYVVGQGSAQVLIDTPQSQIAAQDATNQPGSLYQRALVLGDLMASGPEQEAIAHKLGITLEQLQVVPPPSSIVQPIRATSLGVASQKITGTQASWKLSVVNDSQLPLIAFNTVAPTPFDAQRLAQAAIDALRERMRKDATADRIPTGQRLVAAVIGPALGAPYQVGPRKLYGFATIVFVLGLAWLTIIVVVGRRQRLASEQPMGGESQIEVPAMYPLSAQDEDQPAASEMTMMTSEIGRPPRRRRLRPGRRRRVARDSVAAAGD